MDFIEAMIKFSDPIGSLVSTLLVSGLWVVGWLVTLFQNVRLEECNIGRV